MRERRPRSTLRDPKKLGRAAIALYLACGLGALSSACNGWDPRRPFERESPEVDTAIRDLDAGKPEGAEAVLEKYLETGSCLGDAGLRIGDLIREKKNGAFDLGLTLFRLAERYGARFGEEEDAGTSSDDARRRSAEIDCVLPLVRAIADDPETPPDLRARAQYLAGNLEFLRRKYQDAIDEYDKSLAIEPAVNGDGGDGIGRDAAHNRAIAVRRIAVPMVDASAEGGTQGIDPNQQGDGDGGATMPKPQPNEGDAGADASDQPSPSSSEPDAGDGGKGEPPPPQHGKTRQEPVKPDDGSKQPDPKSDDRILDQLDKQPTYQQEEARQRPHRPNGPPMEDK